MILWKIGTPGFEILEKFFILVMARETMLIMIAGHDHSVAGRIFHGSNTDYLLHHVNIPIYVHKEPRIRENGALYSL